MRRPYPTVHIDHEESVPFPWGNGIGKPTLKGGHLPLKLSPDNSHQAFKAVVLFHRKHNATQRSTAHPPNRSRNPGLLAVPSH